MQQSKANSGPILRLFEARARQGCSEELLRKFATTSAEVVRNKPGNAGYFFGRGVASDDNIVMFASIWDDLSAVQNCFGKDWQSSYLPEGYEELIDECSVRHFDLSSIWAHSRILGRAERLIAVSGDLPLNVN